MIPKVSVFCVTYNHSGFLKQTLEGFVTQKTNFPFEVIIGDDCSTDGAKKIIEEYASKYPNIIKPIYHDYNTGSYQNVLDVARACTGEYVAMCDGDDYWIDENKLQKQVDFMDTHKNCNLCFHPVIIKYDDGSQRDVTFPKARHRFYKKTLNINDLENNILEAIQLFEKKSPINLHNLAIEQAAGTLLNLIREKIDADKFEELVRKYMIRIGADDATIPAKNNSEEGDADVIAYFEPIKTAILIQVKKHTGNTDSWAVNQITAYRKNNTGLVDYSKLLWIISTCDDFTKDTKEKAQSANVRLINGRMFAEMLLDAGLKGMDI